MKIHPSTIFAFALTLLIGAMLVYSMQFQFYAGLYVWVGGIPGLIFGLVVLVNDIRDASAGRAPKGVAAEASTELSPSAMRRRVLRIGLWFAGLYAAIWLVGFKLGVPAFFLAYLAIEAKSKWYITLAITILAAAFLIYFDKIAFSFWPEGVFKQWLPWLP